MVEAKASAFNIMARKSLDILVEVASRWQVSPGIRSERHKRNRFGRLAYILLPLDIDLVPQCRYWMTDRHLKKHAFSMAQ
jgi:hypothetical protein